MNIPANYPPSCRKQDSCKPLSASKPSGTLTPPPTANTQTPSNTPATAPSQIRNIIAPMKPTRRTSLIRKLTASFDGSADMDPTEWKPASNRGGTSLGSSEAWAYLSSFYGSQSLPTPRNRDATSLPSRIETNVETNVETTEANTHANMPALTHTPSTPASSFSSDSSDELNLDAITLTLSDVKCFPPRSTKKADLVTPVEKSVPVVVVSSPDGWENVRETHPHHHHHHHCVSEPVPLSGPIPIVRAPHARMRTV